MTGKRLRDDLAAAVDPSRMLLALKAGLAVGIAYWAGTRLPSPVGDYAFYAAFGAIVSMLPTVMSSLRDSLKTGIGLALGIGVAWSMIALNLPSLAAVAVAVTVAVLIAGIPGLGAGSQYIPVAATFVLLLGGSEPGNYSLGYIAQMALGLAVGAGVNLLVVPPLHFRKAAARLATLRETFAATLEDIAQSLVESWPPAHSGWSDRVETLESLVRQTEPAVSEARESARINPRAHRSRYDTQEDVDDLAALNRLCHLTADIGETISGAIWHQPIPVGLPDELREPLSGALAASARLVRAWDAHQDQEQAAGDAERAIESLAKRFQEYQRAGGENTEALAAIVLALRRMLALIESRLRTRRGA